MYTFSQIILCKTNRKTVNNDFKLSFFGFALQVLLESGTDKTLIIFVEIRKISLFDNCI